MASRAFDDERHNDADCKPWQAKLIYTILGLTLVAVILSSSRVALNGGLSTLPHAIPAEVYREKGIPPGINVPDQRALRDDIHGLHEMLGNYYANLDVLKATWMMSFSDPNHLAGFDYIAQKFARALMWKRNFTIGVIGNSVMAGHDNCAYDNYEHQLERIMTPLLAKYGVHFSVRNAAETGGCGDNHMGQTRCIRTLLGEDVDITHYGWTYYEENDHATHELFTRYSLLLKGAPAPLIVDVGGSCAHPDKGFSADWRKMTQAYGKWGFNHFCMQAALAPNGFKAEIKWGVIGDGRHNTTRYAATEKDMYEGRTESLGVLMRNWHPGPKLFEITADGMAFYYTSAILQALELIAKYEAANKPKSFYAEWMYQEPANFNTSMFPAPMFAPREWVQHNVVPECISFEQPVYGNNTIRLVPMNTTTHPFHSQYRDTLIDWNYWEEDKFTQLIPEKERNYPKCQFVDRCAGLEHHKDQQNVHLTFQLPPLRVGYIAVCIMGSGKVDGKDVDSGVYLRHSLSGVFVDTKALDLGKSRSVFQKCLQVQENWGSSGPVPPSNFANGSYLSLVVKPDAEMVRVTQIIAI